MSSIASGQSAPHVWTDTLVRWRVPISFVFFVALIGADVALGHKPRDLSDLADWRTLLGLALVGAGLGMRSWAAGVLRKGKALATEGPYRICRHPLYLGSFLLMLGFCLLIGGIGNLAIVFAPMLALYYLTIRREERRLSQKHGDAWRDYVRQAPAMIPYRWPKEIRADWSLTQWLQNREYQALCTSTVALCAIQLWRGVN